MNAVAEGDVAAVLTRDIEIVRRIELLRIAVRRIHHAENPLTALEGFAADLRTVFQHAPSQRAHWSVVAQDFLDAFSAKSGRSENSFNCVGLRRRAINPLPSRFVVVSCPAKSSSTAFEISSAKDKVSPSSSAAII